jgi:very-short-patch-repair endonuclease
MPSVMAAQQVSSGPLSRLRKRVRARALRRSSPDAEHALWHALRNRQLGGQKFRRQHPVGPYFADFACIEALLIVELDGGQHFDPDTMAADATRTQHLNQFGFHVLRFTNREALVERDAVLMQILNWLQHHHPHPSPLPEGEGVNAPSPSGRGLG